ncbi:MAG: NAD+ synthase [Thermoplasmata archaeon]
MLVPKLREDAEDIIKKFIKMRVEEAGASGVVIGISGGIDSAVVAHLCVGALGKDKVMGVMMPEKASNPQDLDHGIMVAKSLGIEHVVVDITEAVEAVLKFSPKKGDRLSSANVKARCRMTVLYHIANSTNRLVMGCGNKTEIMIGYFTKFGDGGADYMPIGDLYKTQVRELARRIGIPKEILDKPPSAGLWEGQTDEGELGVTYDILDQVLFGLETGLPPERIAKEAGCDMETVSKVQGMIRRSVHKRRLPLIPKVGFKTPAFDWREY